MAKKIWAANDRVDKDVGTPASDGTVAVRLGGTSTPQNAYTDIGLTAGESASFNIASDGYLTDNASLYVADDVTVDLLITATGFNGGLPLTVENVAVADATTTDETSSELALGNAFANGGFDAWSGASTFSNISGDGDGDEVADGWFFTQPGAASNEISRQDGFSIGAAAVEQRYSIRFGRAALATTTNELRLWAILKPEISHRLRGKSVTLRFSAKAGADFSSSGSALGVRLATGTTESEDGDLIDSGGFAGHVNVIDQSQAVSTTATRFEYTVTLGTTIKEIGLQFSFTGVGTAGTNDWVQIQDVELKEATASEEFAAVPETLEFLRTKLSTGGRLFAKTVFTDPGADRVLIWKESLNDFVAATLGTGIVINGTAVELDAQLVDIAGLTPTDSNFIVGNGTNFVAESGATARTSMGVGAADAVTHGRITTSQGAAADTASATFVNTTDAASVKAASFQGDRTTMVANDEVYVNFELSDASGNQSEFGRITSVGTTLTNGAEVGNMRFGLVNAGALSTFLQLTTVRLGPGSNGLISLGIAGSAFSGLALTEGAAITWDSGDLVLTQTGNLLAMTGGTLRAGVYVSTETGGTLTAESENAIVDLATGPTINDGVFTVGSTTVLINNTAGALTITQDTGMTLRLHGTATTGNLTLAARGMAAVQIDPVTNAEAIVSGDVS